jgi:hypothetical protein
LALNVPDEALPAGREAFRIGAVAAEEQQQHEDGETFEWQLHNPPQFVLGPSEVKGAPDADDRFRLERAGHLRGAESQERE